MRFLGHFCCDSCANDANSSYGSTSFPKLDGMIRNYKLDFNFRNVFLLSVYMFLLCAPFGVNVVTSLQVKELNGDKKTASVKTMFSNNMDEIGFAARANGWKTRLFRFYMILRWWKHGFCCTKNRANINNYIQYKTQMFPSNKFGT